MTTDDNKGGRFQICPVGDQVRHKQFYWPSTKILVTRFLLPDGIAELEDFIPVGLASDSPWHHHLYRRIRCVRGTVRISLMCRPAFDYGRKGHETLPAANGVIFRSGSLTIGVLDPLGYFMPFLGSVAMKVVTTVNDRSTNLETFEEVEGSVVDLYSAVRNGYLQRRERAIKE